MKKTYLAAGRGVHAVSACFRCLFLIPIFVLGCFGAHAAAQTQQSVSRVSLDVRDAAIVNVFQTVQQQTGCSFVYNTSDIDTDRKVTVSAQDEPLTALLDKLFAGSDIAYTLRDKHIVLSKKTKNSPPHNAQGGVIIGKTKCDGIQNQMRLFGGRVSPKRKATKISHTHTKKHRSNGF